ncbi:MAG TPA: phosphopantetheine-binding protein, partial [Ktedonobacteraceae bacterium]|nr:phosphopantetheine-binding protein [Ktedonobacteraceae bacterium]
LGLDQVSVHDNFFEVGGYSLLMIQVHSKLNAHWPKRLRLVDLFKYPTISSLANFISQDEPEVAKVNKSPDTLQNRKQTLQKQREIRNLVRNKAQR